MQLQIYVNGVNYLKDTLNADWKENITEDKDDKIWRHVTQQIFMI